MTAADERTPVRAAGIDRRARGEALDQGTAALGVAALLARTGTPRRPDSPPTESRTDTAKDTAVPEPQSATTNTADSAVAQTPHADHTETVAEVRRWDADELANAITELASRFTAAPMGPDTDFFDAGGTSVAAVELVSALGSELGIHPDLDTLFFDARPRRLARRWLADNPELAAPQPETRRADIGLGQEGSPCHSGVLSAEIQDGRMDPGRKHAGMTNEQAGPASEAGFRDTDDLAQLFADLAGADRLPVVGAPERVAPRRILLTGATGFLGSHLLLDLLRHSAAHVVCLVRADNDEEAAHRLEEGLRRFSLPWSREVLRRVTPLAGDLRSPRLGLSGQRWDTLAGDVDSIVNAGAAVDFLRGYPSLRATNVLGPLTLAELACTGRPKPVHHISSLAVFNGSSAATLAEDEPTANVATLPIGYDRSKWAAEAVLRRAGEHGVVATIMRPGGIGGHPETGAHNPRDLNSGITAALMRFRTVPGFRYLNSAPVDWVSRVAAEIVCTPSAWGQTYHLTGAPTSLEQLMGQTTVGGLGIRVQHWEQWCADTVRVIREEPVPELESLAQVLQSPVARRQLAAMVTAPPSSAARTDAFVAARGLPAPASSAAARTKMVEAMAGAERRTADTPFLRFHETLSGTVGPAGGDADTPCDLRLSLSVASSAQVFSARTLDVSGDLTCALLHDEPLTVAGTAIVRPHEGIPRRHEIRHPIMHYQLTLRDSAGGEWWLEGYKFAAAQRRVVRQLGTQVIEIGRPGAPASFTGEVAVPMHTYLADQIDGIEIDPALPERQRRLAKLLWLSWFGGQLGKSLLEPMLRVGTDLLDLRRALRKEHR